MGNLFSLLADDEHVNTPRPSRTDSEDSSGSESSLSTSSDSIEVDGERILEATDPEWSRTTRACQQCKDPLNVLTKRAHHCRLCGFTCCNSCAPLRKIEEQHLRCCNTCNERYKHRRKQKNIKLNAKEMASAMLDEEIKNTPLANKQDIVKLLQRQSQSRPRDSVSIRDWKEEVKQKGLSERHINLILEQVKGRLDDLKSDFIPHYGHSQDFELIFLLDATSSMGKHIINATQHCALVVKRMQEKYETIDAKYGVVVYRDIQRSNSTEPSIECLPSTKNLEDFEDFCTDISKRAKDGHDLCEDIVPGLEEVVKMFEKSKSCTKVLVHIADAPCHGTPISLGIAEMYNIKEKDTIKNESWDMVPTEEAKDATASMLALRAMDVDYYFLKVTSEIDEDNAHSKYSKYHHECLDAGMDYMIAEFDRMAMGHNRFPCDSFETKSEPSAPPLDPEIGCQYIDKRNFKDEARSTKFSEKEKEHVGEWLFRLLTNSMSKSFDRVSGCSHSQQVSRLTHAINAAAKECRRELEKKLSIKKKKKPHYFMSYSTHSTHAREIASNYYHELGKEKKRIWYDKREVDVTEDGMKWGVQNCKVFVCVLNGESKERLQWEEEQKKNKDCETKNDTQTTEPKKIAYFNRPWCIKELEWAIQADKPIIMVATNNDVEDLYDSIISTCPIKYRYLFGNLVERAIFSNAAFTTASCKPLLIKLKESKSSQRKGATKK